jgi:hypothetical protein
MPQKRGPGLRCCAPCAFGCDPCLGSVDIDAGACGGATFSYPLPDPCTGIVTLSDPYCFTEDCLLDECTKHTSYLVYTYNDFGVIQKLYLHIAEHIVYRYTLTFSASTLIIDVSCEVHIGAWTFVTRDNPYGACYGTADSGTCIGEIGSDCSLPSCYAKVAYFYDSTCTTAERIIGCASICGTMLLMSTPTGVHIATYRAEIDMSDCNDFLATHTLARTNADFETTYCVKGLDPGLNPWSQTYVLEDCFPATIDVTLA